MPAFSPIRFYHELRRRRMTKVTLIYLAGAWAVIGACDLLLPQLVVDVDAAMRIVFVLAIVQLPVALVFGWLYDITDQGIQRTAELSGSSSSPDTTLNRRDHLLIGTLSTAVVAILATGAFSISQLPRVIPAPPENSIAVLPFEICTDQDLDIRLAPALAMEVINHLAGRPQLKVIARQSSFTMAGFGLSLPEIAEPLGVRYLLQGEVCRDGDTRTLSVMLFDDDGANVWNHRYQQQTDASDRITQTLPSQVADGVAMQLGGVSALKAVEPVDRRAYEQLLIGREHRWQGNRDKAREAFERALEIQPDYAEAVFEFALLQIGAGDHLTMGSSMESARPYAQEALALARRQLAQNGSSAHTHFVMGKITDYLAYWDMELAWRQAANLSDGEMDARKASVKASYAEAERHFRTSIALNPSVTDTYDWLAEVIEGQGIERRSEGLEVLERARERDPFNLSLNVGIADHLVGRGRHREAMELLERFKTLPRIPNYVWYKQLMLTSWEAKYLDEHCEILVDMLLNHPEALDYVLNLGRPSEFPDWLAMLGLHEEAEAWYLRLRNVPLEGWLAHATETALDNYLFHTGRANQVIEKYLGRVDSTTEQDLLDANYTQVWLYAWYLGIGGQHERAVRLLESAQHASTLWAHELQMHVSSILAKLYFTLGRDEDAQPLLDKIVTHLEAEYASGIRHPFSLHFLAEAYAMQNRDDEALAMLRKAVDYDFRLPCTWLYGETDPAGWHSGWLRFRDDPSMIAICQRMEADLEQQAKRVRAILAQHDIDELMAPIEERAAKTDE